MQTQKVLANPRKSLPRIHIPGWIVVLFVIALIGGLIALNSGGSEPVDATSIAQTNLASQAQQPPAQPIVAKVQANQLPPDQIAKVSDFLEERYLARSLNLGPSVYKGYASAEVNAALIGCFARVSSRMSSGVPNNTGGISLIGERWPGMTHRSSQVEQMTATHAVFLIHFDPIYASSYSIRTEVLGRFDSDVQRKGRVWNYSTMPFITRLVSCKRM